MQQRPLRIRDLQFVWDDGGRLRYGYPHFANDCAARAVAIATQFPYQQVHDRIDYYAQMERRRLFGARSSAENGVRQETMHRLLGGEFGWTWHYNSAYAKLNQLPPGRLVVRVGRHYTAIVDGAIRDVFNPAMKKQWVVVGYWRKELTYAPSVL
jgi:hypothetical protein